MVVGDLKQSKVQILFFLICVTFIWLWGLLGQGLGLGLVPGLDNTLNVKQVLNYYETLGVLEITPTTLPYNQPDDPLLTNMFIYKANVHDQKQRTEQITVNDCFLKNMNIYRYIFIVYNFVFLLSSYWLTGLLPIPPLALYSTMKKVHNGAVFLIAKSQEKKEYKLQQEYLWYDE